ncbi:MAG TPA: DinB family protein [Candidatus Saccharimonadales bacterium]|jgi:hypothetical protein|nr:DinB family protein [Candidatus Saccharimonadales bacterium]
MTPPERDFAINQLDQTRARLLRAVQGLSPEQLLYRPGPDRWSVAENVEHLVVVEGRLLDAMERLLQGPPDLITKGAVDDGHLVTKVGTVVDRVKSPAHSQPTSRWSTEELWPEFEKARRRTRNFVSTTDGDLRRHFVPHFVFGDLDCYQWILFIGAHCNRHSAQSEAVIASPGFPRQHEKTAAR